MIQTPETPKKQEEVVAKPVVTGELQNPELPPEVKEAGVEVAHTDQHLAHKAAEELRSLGVSAHSSASEMPGDATNVIQFSVKEKVFGPATETYHGQSDSTEERTVLDMLLPWRWHRTQRVARSAAAKLANWRNKEKSVETPTSVTAPIVAPDVAVPTPIVRNNAAPQQKAA